MRLAPSILSFDLTRIREFLPQLEVPGVELIHLDVMDGQFVPPITFGDSYTKGMREVSNLPFEVHLMTFTPENHFEAFVKAGCSRVIFHIEGSLHAHRHIQHVRALGVEVGLALNPGTPVCALEPLIGDIDQALVMTVNPGWGGQKLIHSTLDKVRQIKKMRPDLTVEVDGGIDDKTIKVARDAGVDLFVTGSFLTNARSIAEGVEALRKGWA